jgi:PGF-CTERM protein
MMDGSVPQSSMRTSTLTIALVSALLVAGAGAGGAFAATTPLQPQASPTGTTTTGVGTTTAGSGAGTTTSSGAGTTGAGPAITFNDQNSSDGTVGTVLVQSATLPQDGFIAIYDSTRSGNRTEKVIGASYLLNAGTSDNIRIQLNQPLNQTTSLTAVYHVDSNNNSQFDYVSSNGQQDPAPPEGNQRTVDIAQVSIQGSDTGGGTDAGGASTTSGGATAAGAGTQAASGGAGNGTGGGANGSGGNASGGGSGSSGPGFGLAIAVVALLAVALLAVRRN